jgi:dolichyl-phosphate beta-glucosyltransferase
MNPTDAVSRPYSPRVLLAIVGLAVMAAVLAFQPAAPAVRIGMKFAGWMALSVVAGGILRGLRRKAFFGSRLSLHQAFSFDAIFQAAILFNPQLPYPDVESEFLARHTGSSPEAVALWFRVREAASLAIPLSLGCVTAMLGGAGYWALAFGFATAAWTAHRCGYLAPESRPRFLLAIAFGIAASLGEGLLFTAAGRSASPVPETWSAFLLYAVLLAAYELSPAPFTLGVLELGWLSLSIIPGVRPPGLLIVEAYRLFRAVPILLLAIFYLPRYKMSVRDLYDRRLPLVLARTRRARAPEIPDSAGPLLSVVLPAYNEAARLPRYLPDVIAYCSGIPGGGEVLVVDDGSRDETPEYVESLAETAPALRLVRQPRNLGKGAAVRRGVMESKGRFILFADADGATPISECSKLLQAAEEGADVVIGSRKAAGGSVRRDRSLLREFIGSTFYRITNLLAVPGIADTQCGFKLFRRAAARRIFPELRETGWAFDVEILFLAQKFGLTIDEIPVNWTAVEGSKVRPKDALRMLVALLRIRRRSAGLTTSPSSLTAPH